MNNQSRRVLHRMILEWQEPIYNLAYRMLGNEADAADATQEVFTRMVRSFERYDAERDVGPWLYRIARNTIYNMSRESRARRNRESRCGRKLAAALSARVDGSLRPAREARAVSESAPHDALEEKELQEIVQSQLALLPDDERLILVLHYHGGLSQSELAATLSLPRTTVQSRLSRALDHLRRRLRGCRCLEVCPCVEGILRAAKTLTVPPELTTSLLGLASSAGAPLALVGAGLTIGGVMTNKSMIAATVLLAMFCVAGGFVAGRRAGDSVGSGDESRSARAAAVEADYRKLQNDHREALSELEELRRLVGERTRKLELAAASAGGESGESSRESGGGSGEAIDGAVDLEPEFDWTRLAGLLAENLEALSRSMAANGDVSKLAPEEQTLLMDMYAEFMKVARHGRTLSDQPFFDERFLGPLLEALHAESLGLDEEQQDRLHELVGRLSREFLEPLDLAETLPIEAYGVRQQVLSEFTDSMGGLITEEQRERWEALKGVSSRLLEGSRSEFDLPLKKEGPQDEVRDQVVAQWKEAFSVQDDAAARLGPVAEAFLREAQQVLARYEQTPDESRELSSDEKRRLEGEMHELQIRSERELLRLLTPEERTRVPGSVPTFLRFNYRGDTESNRRRGMPF